VNVTDDAPTEVKDVVANTVAVVALTPSTSTGPVAKAAAFVSGIVVAPPIGRFQLV
jgi:hypothetical protein